MSNPEIIMPQYEGVHNTALSSSLSRLDHSMLYKEVKTIIICPTRGSIPARVVQSWMGLMRPMNQFTIGPMFAIGLEVGNAYNEMIKGILGSVDLREWKYILTIEEDNLPPPDGLLKLISSIDGGVDGNKYEAMGGLYWCKGVEGWRAPMVYGNPNEFPRNFIPQTFLEKDKIVPCNGLGMGFTLFKLDMFKNMEPPFFRTIQEVQGTQGGGKMYTQDLWFFEKAGKLGYKFAADTSCRVGHLDQISGIIW